MSSAQSAMPKTLMAGDSLELCFAEAAANYPASEGWAVALALVPVVGGTPVSTNATGGVESWDVLITSAISTDFSLGVWNWALQATKSAQRTTIDTGSIEILADPTVANVDARSHAQKVLDAIEATIEGRASKSQLEMEFADGRRVKHMEHGELLKLKSHYAKIVAAENRKGRGGAKILARF